MKKFLWLILAALVLTGCPSHPPKQPEAPVTNLPEGTVPTKIPAKPTQPEPGETVPVQPKLPKMIDWKANVTPLVSKMLAVDGVSDGSVLLLDNVKNNTNGALSTPAATAALHDILASGKKFTVVSTTQLLGAQQTLGLSTEDSLNSRSKAIGLARYLNAQYVLYSAINGDVKTPTLSMQLMLVQSGEIIWSGDSVVQR